MALTKNQLVFFMLTFIFRQHTNSDDDFDITPIFVCSLLHDFEMMMDEEDATRSRFLAYIQNRTQAELAFHALLHVAIDGEQRKRRWWEKLKSRDWWENIVLQDWDDEDWLLNFRYGNLTYYFTFPNSRIYWTVL